jgi:hypothetical protein
MLGEFGDNSCSLLTSPAQLTRTLIQVLLMESAGRYSGRGKWMVYLQTTYELCFGEEYFEYFESCHFSPWKYKYRRIRVYVWYKDDKHVIWMWIWLILTNINLLDRIWSLWLVRFAHSPPNFIFWLGRLIFSVSINSHPDNIYIFKQERILLL